MFLKIKPQDTLFFRTGRPFSMGAETWVDYVFPPNPSTFYGAIRTFLIFHRSSLCNFLNSRGEEELFKDIGTKNKKGTLKIYGPFLYDEKSFSLLLPVPADLVKVKVKISRKEDEKLVPVSFQKKPDIVFSDYPFEMGLIFKGNEKVKEITGFIDDISLKEYLEGKNKEFSFLEKKEIFEEEWKIGIKRERKTKTSEEGHIYRVPMLRLKSGINFLIKIERAEEFPERGVLQLGAEGKVVKFEVLKENPLEQLKDINFEMKDGIFKLYFLTPAIFKNGWIPDWINRDTLEGEFNGIRVKLIGVALKKYKHIGGWDLANKRPKPMYKAVPEGSVYYFEVLNGAAENKVKSAFHLKTVSDKYPEEGFGVAMVGGIV